VDLAQVLAELAGLTVLRHPFPKHNNTLFKLKYFANPGRIAIEADIEAELYCLPEELKDSYKAVLRIISKSVIGDCTAAEKCFNVRDWDIYVVPSIESYLALFMNQPHES
jgi:hypothetical protein